MGPEMRYRSLCGPLSRMLQLSGAFILCLLTLLLMPPMSHAQPASDDASVGTAPEQTSGGTRELHIAVRTDSPRETISSFERVSEEFRSALANYKQTKDGERAAKLLMVMDQWLSLIDMSKVPEAIRRQVGALTASYVMDVFDRIALPSLADVPDSAAFKIDGPASFLIPNTPFRIVRIETGTRQGEFLFSEHTVQSAPRFYPSVANLPLRSPGMVYSWVSEYRQFTGPMVPAVLLKLVPESLKQPVLGTPVWKIIAVMVLTVIAALLLLLWNFATTYPAWGGLVGESWRLLLSPLGLLLAALGLYYFFAAQIVLVGQFASAVYAALTVVVFLAIAWAFWLFILAVFETVIRRRNLPERNFNADMLRLIAKILGVIGGIIILAYGAQNIGLPVFSLLAGLGIGGLAIALAIRPTLENLIGGFILYLDKPIRVGDFCTFGDSSGTVESIGVRSTQIRALDRTLITVPNAQFADLQIVNWAQCDRMLIEQTIGLRYETELDQMRYVLVKVREMLHGHPRIDSETVRVRFADYGASSLDIDIRIYALTREWNDFYAIKEDVLFRIKTIVEGSGSGFAFPSQTLYMARDEGLDADLGEKAKQDVAALRRAHQLPFPKFGAARLEELNDKLSYPPFGSPEFNATAEELADSGSEPLSAAAPQDESGPPSEEADQPKGIEDK